MQRKKSRKFQPDKEKETKHVEKFASHREEDIDGKFSREPVTISESAEKLEGENVQEELAEHSLRMGNLRVKAKNQSLEGESSQQDSRKKKLVQEHARRRKQRKRMLSIQKMERE